MADRENELRAGERIVPLGGMHLCGGKRAVFDHKTVQPMGKADLSAAGEDIPADGLDHARQHVRADVGLGVIEHVLPGTVLIELAQHKGDAAVVGAGVQLAVGKGAGAALAELDVVFSVQRAAGAKALDCRDAGVHVPSALEYNGSCSRAGKQQRGKHARRAKAHDNGARVGCRNAGDHIVFFNIG